MKKIASLLLISMITFALMVPATSRLRAHAQAGNSYTAFIPLLVKPLMPEYSLIYQIWDNLNPTTHLWRVNSDGTNKVDLDCENCRNPVWSPDGTTILYSLVQGNLWKIYRMDADGSNKVWLGQHYGYSAVYSPDGSKIAYGDDSDGDGEIFVMDADGNNSVQLTDNDVNEGNLIQWSPDGQKISFLAFTYNPGNSISSLVIINADGSNRKTITPSGVSDSSPRWSPDGSRIVFVSSSTAGHDLYTVQPDGKNRRQLTTSGGANDPAWSPDGSMITYAYTNDADYENHEIRSLGADGSGDTLLYAYKGLYSIGGYPMWSPDGSMVAFAGVDMDNSGNEAQNIYVVYVSTKFVKQLTEDARQKDVRAWSPVKMP
jgi:Tol biopolymer transport system component